MQSGHKRTNRKHSIMRQHGGPTHVCKEIKRDPSSSSTADTRGALREVNRRAHNKFSLEHMREHQDRTAKFEDISLEAQPNVDCDEIAKKSQRIND